MDFGSARPTGTIVDLSRRGALGTSAYLPPEAIKRVRPTLTGTRAAPPRCRGGFDSSTAVAATSRQSAFAGQQPLLPSVTRNSGGGGGDGILRRMSTTRRRPAIAVDSDSDTDSSSGSSGSSNSNSSSDDNGSRPIVDKSIVDGDKDRKHAVNGKHPPSSSSSSSGGGSGNRTRARDNHDLQKKRDGRSDNINNNNNGRYSGSRKEGPSKTSAPDNAAAVLGRERDGMRASTAPTAVAGVEDALEGSPYPFVGRWSLETERHGRAGGRGGRGGGEYSTGMAEAPAVAGIKAEDAYVVTPALDMWAVGCILYM